MFAAPQLAAFEFVWRLDSDSFLLGPPAADPVLQVGSVTVTVTVTLYRPRSPTGTPRSGSPEHSYTRLPRRTATQAFPEAQLHKPGT